MFGPEVFQTYFLYSPESVAIDNFPQENNEWNEWFKEAQRQTFGPEFPTIGKSALIFSNGWKREPTPTVAELASRQGARYMARAVPAPLPPSPRLWRDKMAKHGSAVKSSAAEARDPPDCFLDRRSLPPSLKLQRTSRRRLVAFFALFRG